jgi:hypothetical protein
MKQKEKRATRVARTADARARHAAVIFHSLYAFSLYGIHAGALRVEDAFPAAAPIPVSKEYH